MGGPSADFPATRAPLLQAVAGSDERLRRQGFEELIAGYWKPIYKYIRLRKSVSNEDAKDLTQAFLARALEKGFFAEYDPAKSRFRTFLRLCVDRFVANEAKAAGRIKRGGGSPLLLLDFGAAEEELQRFSGTPSENEDDFFHKEWVRHLFTWAVQKLKEECLTNSKQVHFALFERYDLEDPAGAVKSTYEQLAREWRISSTQVTNHLAWARRRFREIVLDKLRALTGSDEEFQTEARRLLG